MIEPMGKHILKGYVKGKNVILVICLTVMQKKKVVHFSLHHRESKIEW